MGACEFFRHRLEREAVRRRCSAARRRSRADCGRRAPDQLPEPRARVIADDDAIAAVSCRPAIARPIVENLDDLAPPWIDNGNAVIDHRVLIIAVLRHDPYDIRRQSVRLHARRQPSADVDLDIEVLTGGRPVVPQLIDDLPALIVVTVAEDVWRFD